METKSIKRINAVFEIPNCFPVQIKTETHTQRDAQKGVES